MRLKKTQEVLGELGITFTYTEEDGLGSLDFLFRGVRYHIWEFDDGGAPCGVETNIKNAGRSEDIEGDYETVVCDLLRGWK